MTDNEIIRCLRLCRAGDCENCKALNVCDATFSFHKEALDLINRQKAEIERLNKNYEELIYKTECLLCHATGNKFSKYTYTTQEMISFADDYIQDCCDEAIEETKASVKSEAIKEFIDELKNRVVNKYEYTDIRVFKEIDNLVKEMTKAEKALEELN